MFHRFPNQMRYQAAPLPDDGFPRGSLNWPQVALGTKRNRPAQCGTLCPTFSDTVAAARLPANDGLTNRAWSALMAGQTFNPVWHYLEGIHRERIVARFWSLVDQRGSDECWPYRKACNGKGYGRFKIASYQTAHANRVAWAIANGRDPGEMLVRHSCDNPPCCNPAHLLLGTHQQNAQDKVERGRCNPRPMNGENNANARLTVAQVGEIVGAFRRHENNTEIARRYPVGHALISRIRTGRSWCAEAAMFGWEPKSPAPNQGELGRE